MWSFHIANCHMDKAMYRHTSFHCTSFHCALQILGIFLYKLKTCDNPTSSKSMHTIHTIFATVFIHFMYPCHILASITMFSTFSLLFYCDDLCWVTFDVLLIVVGHRELYPCKMAKLIDTFCVF